MSYATYLRLRKNARCSASPIHLCRFKHPSQLLSSEVGCIKAYCTDPRWLHWPLSAVYQQMLRDKAGALTISTFYKYVSLLKLQRTKAAHRRKHHHTGIRAEGPLQILHADVTIFRTLDNARNYIYLVQDNYSRAILIHRAEQDCKAQYVFENLQTIREQLLVPWGITGCQLITDDGSENHGPVHQVTQSPVPPCIKHLIAQQDIEFSNSMIEAAHKQLKYRFLYHHAIAGYRSLVRLRPKAIEDYNHRPQAVLHGLTTWEVLSGKRSAPSAYQLRLASARTKRLTENKKGACCYSF